MDQWKGQLGRDIEMSTTEDQDASTLLNKERLEKLQAAVASGSFRIPLADLVLQLSEGQDVESSRTDHNAGDADDYTDPSILDGIKA